MKLFLLHRSADTGHAAARMSNALNSLSGIQQVATGVDAVGADADAREKVSDILKDSTILLVLIGEQWLTLTDDQGRLALFSPNDLVRLEIEIAISLRVRIVPVLFDDAELPEPETLPESIRSLASCPTFRISHETFHDDVRRLFNSTVDLRVTKGVWSVALGILILGVINAILYSWIGTKTGIAFGVLAGLGRLLTAQSSPTWPARVVSLTGGLAFLGITALIIADTELLPSLFQSVKNWVLTSLRT